MVNYRTASLFRHNRGYSFNTDKEKIMSDITIRRAAEDDIPALEKLLFQVHKVHSDVRPDLFKAGNIPPPS